MPRSIVPITVLTRDGPVDVEIRASGPAPWSQVHSRVVLAAGLPARTRLYLGIGEVEPGWLVGSPPLLCGAELRTVPTAVLPDRPLMVLAVVAGPDAGCWVRLPAKPMIVGRDPDAGLPLSDPQASFRHAVLEPTATGLAVRDLGSTNGVRVDGRAAPVDRGPRAGTGTTIPGARAVTGSLIRIGGTLLQIQLTAEPVGPHVPDGRGHLVRQASTGADAPAPPPIPDDPGDPPRRQRRPLPLVAALLGAAVGGCLALVLGSPAYLAFAALGPVTMLGTALSDRVGGRRSYRRQVAAHRAAVERRAQAVAIATAAYATWAWDHWPDAATLLRRAEATSARLWDRRHGQAGYLQVSVGAHTRSLRRPGPPGTTGIEGAGTEVPATVDLASAGILGLIGERGRALARWLLAQLAALHSPGDVALMVIGTRPDLQVCRHLPHARTAAEPARIGTRDLVVVLDGADAIGSPLGSSLLAAARRDLDAAAAVSDGAQATAVTTSQAVAAHGPAAAAAGPRVHVLCLVERADHLPPGCTAPASSAGGSVDITGVRAGLLARVCRALAPLREPGGRPSSAPPPSISLPDLLDPITAASLRERWRRPTPVGILGASSLGVATLDLDTDGPHLLVAGTTGSGKSELLLTLIASLAIASPPSELTLLLIDYKGGAAFDAVAGLPHVVGTVTDLDPALSTRALASLRAELRRRERIAGTAAGRPPRLMIVIDEFATLAAELPEFLSGILDVARRGRSLGLHLVLATQRPAGVVSPAMRSNISARICLRVTDPADSIDVVGVPDAARISPGTPGRALLRTGSGLTTFQTALSTAPGEPEIAVLRVAPALGARAQAGPDGSTAPSTLREIVDAASSAASDLPAPHRPWLPPLPHRYRPTGRASEFLALADLPELQARRGLLLPTTSVLVTGPPHSGRSTTLRRIAAIAAARGAELLVVDAASGLSDLRCWPAVSSYLTLAQPHLVLRLAALLVDPRLRPADGRARWLLVDGYDLVAAALDRADYVTGSAALAEVPTRAVGTVRLAVAGPPALVHHRQVAGFSTVIALEAAAGGAGHAGRAGWAGRTVQIADAPMGSNPPASRGDGWLRGRDRVVVRPLPSLVSSRDLPAPRPEAIPLGMGGDAAQPMTVDLCGSGGAIVVSGPRRCGVTTALQMLAAGAARAGIPVLRLEMGAVGPEAAGITRVDLRRGTDALRASLAAHRGPLLLVVDQCGEGATHPAAEILERFCQVCGPGQHLLLGERIDELSRAHRGHLRAALAFRRGLLLSPDTADGALLDVSLPRRAGTAPPGRGVWAEAGAVTPVQVARWSR